MDLINLGVFIKEYVFPFLQIVLIWPVAFLFFLFVFREEISKFIDEIAEVDWSNKKVTRNNQETKPSTLPELKGSKTQVSGKWDYKRLYLNLYLTANSLAALEWFYRNPGKYSSIDFGQKFQLLHQTGRTEGEEKDAILSALREAELIELANNYYKISEEGEEYLKYRRVI